MKTRRVLASVSIITLMTFVAPVGFADAAPGAAEIYKAKCASCHGADGAGQTKAGIALKARDLRSPEVQKQTDAELLKVTADGQKKMPAYKKKLSVADLTSLVAYIRGMAAK